MNRKTLLIPLAMVAVLLVLQACSTKHNTSMSRFWQGFTTRYNVYYHGRTNYDEQLAEMLNAYEDDYSQHVLIHPAEARANPKAPQPSGSFDRTIEKMQKAIALHSIKKKPKRKAGKGNDPKYKEWLRRTEYNPFIHNAWFTMAQAQYMKGDFLNAAATFRYIARNFVWKPDLVLEAQVWEALSYCAMGWTTEADNVLVHVHIDQIEDKRVRSLANLAMADYYVKSTKYEQAIPYLREAVQGAKGSQRTRLNFLLGQLYEDAGNKTMAYEAYRRAGSSSSSTYRTKFNARIKQSAVYQGENIDKEVRALRSMARYDRNKTYLDQIYYAIGNLYLSRGDTVHAVESYVKAAEKSTRNGIDKAISQLTLGGIYFAQRKYDKAQPCYSEAIPQIPETYPDFKMLKHRSDVLDELAVYAQNVTLQDSLLRLSKMTPEEQRKIIKKIIEDLKKKEKEEKDAAAREQYLAQQNAKGSQLKNNANAPNQFQMNTDNSWYFYNTATKNAGKTAFQQQWGNRKLEDNWRRRDKTTFSLNDDDDAEQDTTLMAAADSVGVDSVKVDKEALKRSEDPHYEEYYLKQIPTTEEQIQAAHDIIQAGLYNMGVILKDKLEDFDAAAYQFEELLRRYPDNQYRLDTYYNMYLMYERLGYHEKSEPYRQLILTHFADSKEGTALKDPNYINNLKAMLTVQESLYEQAYDAYLNNDNATVHAVYGEMTQRYPLSPIMPKFMFIDALSYVTSKDYDKFKSTIKDMLQRYPQTDITPVASGIVKNLNAGRKIEGGGSNARGMLWSTRLGGDSIPPDSLEAKFTPFKEDENKPQVFVLLYPTDSVSSNLLLYSVARHNFTSFVVRDYDLEQMSFGHMGLLVVRGFANFGEAKHYRSIFEADKELQLPRAVYPVIISVENFELLLNEHRSFEDYFNFLEEQNDTEHASLEGRDVPTPADEEEPPLDEDEEEEEDEEEPLENLDEHSTEKQPQEKPTVMEQPEKQPQEKPTVVEQPEKQPQEKPTVVEQPEKQPQEKPVVEQQEQPQEKPVVEQQEQPEQDSHDTQRDIKQREKERKEAAKQREKERKEREKAAEKERKEREKAAEQARKDKEKAERQARIDKENAAKLAQEQRADSVKLAKKTAEQERKDKLKAKEQERKAKAEERKLRQKEREAKRKAEQKRRKEEAKAKAEAAKQRQKERKEAAKQREKERKEAAKQREQERKEREKQREQERKGKK